jgi:ABC-type multidrug transport system fused ATPase/permease subunit
MNLTLTHYRNLFGVYLRPQRARVALLAVLLLAVTALQLWSPQLLRQFIDAAAAVDAPPRTLLTLAALMVIRTIAVQAMADEREARARMFGPIEERLAGLDDMRANGGDYAIQRLDDLTRVVLRAGERAAIRSSWIWITTIGTFTLGYALTLGLGAFLFFRAV